MRLYVFRHGIAINRTDPKCPPEEDRCLTKKGIRRTVRAARGLKALGADPKLVVSSPYARALETGIIASKVFKLKEKKIVTAEELLPDAAPDTFLKKLPSFADVDVLCAGHAPQLDLMLAAALGAPAGAITALGKAGAACLEFKAYDQLPATLVWLLEPRALRALAR